MSITKNILRVEHLSYDYGATSVWEDVNLEISRGEVVFLVGHNGSGKSTLLRCLAGLSKAREGEIFLNEELFAGSAKEQRSHIAFVSDVPIFYDDLTAEEHIQFVLRANRRTEEYAYADQLLEEFDLERHKKQYPSSFSRGMKEKLALILALIVKPDLYLLDEPYGPLDHKASVLLSQKLQKCADEGAGILLSCHHAVPDLKAAKTFILQDSTLNRDDSYSLGKPTDAHLSPSQKNMTDSSATQPTTSTPDPTL